MLTVVFARLRLLEWRFRTTSPWLCRVRAVHMDGDLAFVEMPMYTGPTLLDWLVDKYV